MRGSLLKINYLIKLPDLNLMAMLWFIKVTMIMVFMLLSQRNQNAHKTPFLYLQRRDNNRINLIPF